MFNNTLFKSGADSKWFFASFVVMVVFFSISPDWCDWLMDSEIGDTLSWMLTIIEDHEFLNVTIVILTILGCVLVCKKWWRDEDNRLYRFLLVIFGLQLLWVLNPLRTFTIYESLDYRWLCTMCLSAILALTGVKWVMVPKRNKMDVSEQYKERFSIDKIDTSRLSKSMKQYGDDIVSHLLGTELNEDSFAIGITGTWGSGKTTFMKYLEEQLLNKVEIVKFNPWMCKSPEQVTEDFFVTLYRQLSPKHSTLSRPIRDYARYVSMTTFSLGNGILSKLALSIPHESLESSKERLSGRFSLLRKPVVVFIDDLDRLEKNEVFEVLRLIRNTADLRKLFYIAAFDKDYVVRTLSEKKISDADAYLEKIFPVEVPLPKVEETQLYQALFAELSKHHRYKDRLAKRLFGMIDRSDREIIMEVLNNYRRILRFARLYLLNLDYLQKTFKQEFKIIDLFWLEILQVYDQNTYNTLAYNRELLLNTVGKVYSIREGVKSNKISDDKKWDAYDGAVSCKPLTLKILTLLFEDRKNLSDYSVCYAENYNKYFTLSVSGNRLSFAGFRELFNKERDSLSVVAEWFKGEKYYSSLLYHFEHTDVSKLSPENLGRYVMGLLELAYLSVQRNERIVYDVKRLLRRNRYAVVQHSWSIGYIWGWVNEKTVRPSDLQSVSKVLHHLYISDEIDENGHRTKACELLIKNEDIKTLLRCVMTKFLELHQEVTAVDVLNRESELGTIFGNCTVCIEYNSQIEADSSYENVAFDMVIDYLERKEKPTFKQFDDAISQMTKSEIPDGLSPMEYDEYIYNMEEQIDMQKIMHLGSDWKKVTEFKERCFRESAS